MKRIKRWHIHVGIHTSWVIAAICALIFSAAVLEACQKREKQFGAVSWGQTVLADQPTATTCWERVSSWLRD